MIIVGGGIVGCASAYYLSKRGVSVIVCEKGDVGIEQSSRNWGFVRQQGRDAAELPLMMASNHIWQGLEAQLQADLESLARNSLTSNELLEHSEDDGIYRFLIKKVA